MQTDRQTDGLEETGDRFEPQDSLRRAVQWEEAEPGRVSWTGPDRTGQRGERTSEWRREEGFKREEEEPSPLGRWCSELVAVLSPARLTGRFMNPGEGELWRGSADLVASVMSG